MRNAGYGAVGGRPTPRETENVARFDREGGVPALWLAVVIGSVLVMLHQASRRTGGALLMMLGIQVGFWLFATHMQSRFLLPTLLPACLIAGSGYERLSVLARAKAPSATPLIGIAIVITMVTMSYVTLNSQTKTVPNPEGGPPLQTPIWMAIEAPIGNNEHPINQLPEDSKTLLVADNMGLLYLRRPFVYASAFDEAPLGNIIRRAGGEPTDVNQLLREAGITHVWVHWAELSRLHRTYGHDAEVTIESLRSLIATGWQPIQAVDRSATLFAMPPLSPESP